MAYCAQIFAGVDALLCILGTCLVSWPGLTHSHDSCLTFPSIGFSFDPLSTLSFSQPKLEELAVPFTPELRHQHGIDVSCLPFSISPIPLPEVVKSLTPSQTELPDSVTFDAKSVDFSMVRLSDSALAWHHDLTRRSQLAFYPVLLPIYLMRYDLQIPAVSEAISFTCMVQAHSEHV